MDTQPGILAMLSIAASISLLSGWRLYASILATGLAMRWHLVPLPEHLQALQALASPWVIGAAAFAALCELFADKVSWIDSVWDLIHTAIRPAGGAMLTAAVLDPSNPTMQTIAYILGGGGALLAHAGKAGTRAMVNTSPEPFSNIALSTTEDAATGGLLYVVYAYPHFAGVVAAALALVTAALLHVARKAVRQLLRRRTSVPPSEPPVN